MFDDGQVIDTLTPKWGANRANDPKQKAEPVWDKDQHSGSWRAIWAFSAKRFAHDNATLTKQEKGARDVIAGAKAARMPPFVAATKDGHTLNEAALARARKLAGLKGYSTNLPATLMAPGDDIAAYHDL